MENLGTNIGKLGFGLMRLPQKNGVIDIEQVKNMVDLFLDARFNYFDTAWAYPGSEDAIRKALVERYPRDKFILATKNAAWIKCKTKEDAIKQFETSLLQTNAGYFDYYLLHNLGEGRTHFFDDFDLWNFVREQKKLGKIKHYGFSFHSTADELDVILTSHPDAEFVQLQINYADWDSKTIQSKKCLEVAKKHGKPVIVMEPVKGGLLADPPKSVVKILHDADPTMSNASWALRFAADQDNVLTVLSGMSNIEQMKDNISFMKGFKSLSISQRETIEKAKNNLESLPIVPCTGCNYCAKVCPKNIGVSGSLYSLNLLNLYGNRQFATEQISWLVSGHGMNSAEDCIECGECEKVCPQHIKIRDELKIVKKLFLNSNNTTNLLNLD